MDIDFNTGHYVLDPESSIEVTHPEGVVTTENMHPLRKPIVLPAYGVTVYSQPVLNCACGECDGVEVVYCETWGWKTAPGVYFFNGLLFNPLCFVS